MGDAYDVAIEYFTKNPNKITDSWFGNVKVPYGYLFAFLSKDRTSGENTPRCYACPAQLRSAYVVHGKIGLWETGSPELTELISKDESLPTYFTLMSEKEQVSYLPALANAQRLADKMLNREPPKSPTSEVTNGIG